MREIKIEKIDLLYMIADELSMLSYLQLLVEEDGNAKILDISHKMHERTASYLKDRNAEVVNQLYSLIYGEDFTIVTKQKK